MATAEVAPVTTGTQGPSGVNFPIGEISPAQKIVSPVVPEMGTPIEIAVEAKGAKVSVTILDEIPTARPKTVLFAGNLGMDLRLLKAIPLEVSVEEGQVVLTWSETDDFACGDNTGEALDHFGQSIRELYSHLHDPHVVLGADLLRVRDVLDRYITARKHESPRV